MEEQQQQHRRKETAESGTRQPHHQAPGAKAPASQDALAQPTIIECRKKNSKQESVVTHRFRKGKLLGKVRVCLRGNMRGSLFDVFWGARKIAKRRERGKKAVCFLV